MTPRKKSSKCKRPKCSLEKWSWLPSSTQVENHDKCGRGRRIRATIQLTIREPGHIKQAICQVQRHTKCLWMSKRLVFWVLKNHPINWINRVCPTMPLLLSGWSYCEDVRSCYSTSTDVSSCIIMMVPHKAHIRAKFQYKLRILRITFTACRGTTQAQGYRWGTLNISRASFA